MSGSLYYEIFIFILLSLTQCKLLYSTETTARALLPVSPPQHSPSSCRFSPLPKPTLRFHLLWVPTRALHANRIKFSCLLRIEDSASVCVPVMSPEVSLAYYTPGLPATVVRAPSANSFPIWSATHSTYLSYLVPLRTTCDFFNKNFVAIYLSFY